MIFNDKEFHSELSCMSRFIKINREVSYSKSSIFLEDDLISSVFFLISYRNWNGLDNLDLILSKKIGAIVLSKDQYLRILDKSKLDQINLYVVDSVDLVLKKMILFLRKKLNSKVFIIWGSTGKSQVNLMFDFAVKNYYISKSNISEMNNIYGIFQFFCSLVGNEEYLFIEIGGQKRSELKSIVESVLPEYGVLTSIQHCHLNYLNSFSQIIKFKSEVLLVPSLRKIYLHDKDYKLLKNKHKNELDFKINRSKIFFCRDTHNLELIHMVLREMNIPDKINEDFPRGQFGFTHVINIHYDLAYDLRTSSYESVVCSLRKLTSALTEIDALLITVDDNWGIKKIEFLTRIGALLSKMKVNKIYYFGSNCADLRRSYYKNDGKGEIIEKSSKVVSEVILNSNEKLHIAMISQWTYSWIRKLVNDMYFRSFENRVS